MKFFRTILYLLLFSTSLPTHAVIGKVTKLEHPITRQTLLLADDVHLDIRYGKNTQKQQDDLAFGLDALHGHLKVEEITAPTARPSDLGLPPDSPAWIAITDRLDYLTNIDHWIGAKSSEAIKIMAVDLNGEGDEALSTWEDAYGFAPMIGLSKKCAPLNIEIDNVECRFLTYEATLPIKTFIDAYEAIIKTIRSWHNDPQELQAAYNQLINQYCEHPFIKELHTHLSDNSAATMADAIDAGSYYGTYYDAVSPLIDARLLHSIYTTRNQSVVFSLCGADHHKSIMPTLHALGYKEKATYGQNYAYDEVNNRCVMPLLNINTMFNDVGNHITARKACDAITPLMASTLSLAPFPMAIALALV